MRPDRPAVSNNTGSAPLLRASARLRQGVHNSLFQLGKRIWKKYISIEDIVTVAELQDGFYEVEVTVLVRRSGGSESDFIRMQLESYDGEKKCRQLTVKGCRHSGMQWF